MSVTEGAFGYSETGGPILFKNFTKCPHCKIDVVALRANDRTPLINRSDEATFHLSLFSSPERRRAVMGELIGEQLVCNFLYVHNRLGTGNRFVMAVVTRASSDHAGGLVQVEEVADLLADLLGRDEAIGRVYSYEKKQLHPGLPH